MFKFKVYWLEDAAKWREGAVRKIVNVLFCAFFSRAKLPISLENGRLGD